MEELSVLSGIHAKRSDDAAIALLDDADADEDGRSLGEGVFCCRSAKNPGILDLGSFDGCTYT